MQNQTGNIRNASDYLRDEVVAEVTEPLVHGVDLEHSRGRTKKTQKQHKKSSK